VTAEPLPPTKEWVADRARGFHEVIIESPDHDGDPSKFSRQELERLVTVYRDRYACRIADPGVKFVSIFKNWGRVAGASLSHTHSQLVALPIVPPALLREMEAIRESPRCPYCSLAEREAASDRLIFENDQFVLIAPFVSEVPYETWILPKEHASSLEGLDPRGLEELAEALGERSGGRTGSCRARLQLLHPPTPPSPLPPQPQDTPGDVRPGGFEKNTGIFINSVPPEVAAESSERSEGLDLRAGGALGRIDSQLCCRSVEPPSKPPFQRGKPKG
jgi:UDPglucose--hexose-1-phosphate uridylyltransferase